MMEIKKGDRFLCFKLAGGHSCSRGLFTIHKVGGIYECLEDGYISVEKDDAIANGSYPQGFPWKVACEDGGANIEDYLVKLNDDMELNINVKEGWKLNPNDKVVNAILKRCVKNDGICPCMHDDEDYEGRDLHCPCTDYLLKDKCCCGLYVKKDEKD